MKLRYKKTGEVFDAIVREKGGGDTYSLIVCDIKAYQRSKSTTDGTHYVLDEYDTLAELNEEWEDYRPIEPLIRDEKIRKAVRAWAEANNRDSFLVINEHFNCCRIIGYTDGGNASCDKIEFGTTIAGANKDYHYTIDELCGEEEE